ncbi:hypothetical protein B0H19DRAFT_1077625 [Mycena capillaripes]|nr:hypothetical protein B0H19DRAFT_1077625 [Mycena capillaripes]
MPLVGSWQLTSHHVGNCKRNSGGIFKSYGKSPSIEPKNRCERTRKTTGPIPKAAAEYGIFDAKNPKKTGADVGDQYEESLRVRTTWRAAVGAEGLCRVFDGQPPMRTASAQVPANALLARSSGAEVPVADDLKEAGAARSPADVDNLNRWTRAMRSCCRRTSSARSPPVRKTLNETGAHAHDLCAAAINERAGQKVPARMRKTLSGGGTDARDLWRG